MPESRDRLPREESSIIASYSQRRISRTGGMNIGRGNSIAFVLEDDNEEEQAARTPFRWRDTSLSGNPGSITVAARGVVGTSRIRPTRNLSTVVGNGRSRGGAFGTPGIRRVAPSRGPENLSAPSRGPENLSPVVGGGHGRGRGVALPNWYPRRPLNDITAVVRAIERRRERGGDGEGLETESPVQNRASHDQVSTPSARLEHKITTISPLPSFSNGRFPPSLGKVPKILLNITHNNKGDAAACLTPQKQLLNNIDTVEKVVMEELRKLKRTPSAKKAEREKRVRTLMSMR